MHEVLVLINLFSSSSSIWSPGSSYHRVSAKNSEGYRETYFSFPIRLIVQGTRGRRNRRKQDTRQEKTGEAGRGGELLCFLLGDHLVYFQNKIGKLQNGLSHVGAWSGQESHLAALRDSGIAVVGWGLRWRAVGGECEWTSEKWGPNIQKTMNKFSCLPELSKPHTFWY